MKRKPAEDVVAFLGFSEDQFESLQAISKFSHRNWDRVQRWLDDSGLAFYFWQRLKDENAVDKIPPSVSSRLERNLASNQLRIDGMARSFCAINKKFDDAGVRYQVVKGFSLVPQFCPHAPLRHQSDLDYLVDEHSLPVARDVLIEAGYTSQKSLSSKESIFVSAGAKPARGDRQYSPESSHAVELHTDVWDGEMHGFGAANRVFSADQAVTRRWNGLVFPGQTDEDAFLLQVLHACRHIFTQWIRMSCLFEIGYFLSRRASDAELWGRIEQRALHNPMLREFAVIVVKLVAQVFAVPIPELIQEWAPMVCPAARVWLKNYARSWVFCELPAYQVTLFPSSKLVLFLQQHYKVAAPKAESSPSRASRALVSLRNDPRLFVNEAWWGRQLVFRRSLFFVLAGARYLCELPRWRWLTRREIAKSTVAAHRSGNRERASGLS